MVSPIAIPLVGSLLLGLVLWPRDTSAQDTAPAATPAPAAAPAPAATPAPAAAPAPEPEEADEVRFRGGFLIGGGPFIVPDADASGGGAMVNFRLGVQINHIFSVYYQGMGVAGALVGNTDAAALAGASNSIMAGFTLGHFFDLGIGPSVDLLAAAAAGLSGAAAGTTVRPGADARVAFILGGDPDEDDGDRLGFSIGADLHPTFLEDTVLMTFTVGIGAEWY